MVQKCWRGHWCRRNHFEVMSYLREIRKKIDKHYFYHKRARSLQNRWRTYRTESRYQRLRVSSVVLQNFIRMRIWRSWFQDLKGKTGALQQHWRKWWLLQSEKFVEEALADERLQMHDREGILSTNMATRNVLFGKYWVLGMHTNDGDLALGTMLSTLERLSDQFTVLSIALGGSMHLALAEPMSDKVNRKTKDIVVVAWGLGWVNFTPPPDARCESRPRN